MAERHIKTDIAAFLSNSLPESRRREVESHVTHCAGCRHALDKSRAKQSRQRRQALKTAQPGAANLFLNRLSKQGDIDSKSSSGVWIWIFLFLVVGGGAYYFSHYQSRWFHAAPIVPPLPLVEIPKPEPTTATKRVPITIGYLATTSTPTVAKPIRVAEVNASSPAVTSAADIEEPERPRFWSGTDSDIKEERQVTVRGATQWRTLWAEMGHTDPAPHINFITNLVVGVFAGEKPSVGYTVLFREVVEQDAGVSVGYSVENPPINSSVPQKLTHPYALRTILRSPKPIRFSEDNK